MSPKHTLLAWQYAHLARLDISQNSGPGIFLVGGGEVGGSHRDIRKREVEWRLDYSEAQDISGEAQALGQLAHLVAFSCQLALLVPAFFHTSPCCSDAWARCVFSLEAESARFH